MKTVKSSRLLLVLTLLVLLGGATVISCRAISPDEAQATDKALASASQAAGDQSPKVPAATAIRKDHQATIIDHNSTDLSQVPENWIEQAKAQHRVSYGHTSHGSQPISGMGALMADPSNVGLYNLNTNGAIQAGVLSISDQTPDGDLGNPDRSTWASRTRDYLNGSGSDRNVIVWSWCGQADTTEANIETYLNLMNELEGEFPDVTFVYMTGHLNGTGTGGDLNQRNDQIRDYCMANDKVLFDFADIESYDPDGNYYPDADDSCPWCDDWCNNHPEDCTNLPESCAHSHPFNCLRKGKAFWWMMARLAGWEGQAHQQSSLPASLQTVSASFADPIQGALSFGPRTLIP